MGGRRVRVVAVVVCGALLAAVLAAVGSSAPAGAAVPPGFELAWGALGSGNGQLTRPVAVAAQLGFVYVVDSGNNRIEVFNDSGDYLGQFGSLGSGNNQFNNPNGVAVGPDGSVYVADTGNQRVVKFDYQGNFQAKWGTYGTGNGQFNFPSGVAVDPVSGDVFVADTLNHRVQKFTSTGTYKTKWGAQGARAGRFDTPGAIAVSPARAVYVADGGNDRVEQFTGTGVFQGQWGGAGTADGRFDSPSGIAVDSAGSVYVADTHNHRIQQFTAAGAFLSKWGTNGSGNGQFATPVGVGISSNGVKVLVADTFNHRVQRFTPAGAVPGAQPTFVNTWGGFGAGDGQFDTPWGVAVDLSGNVYVADPANDRIQKFSSTGGFLTRWGTYGYGDGEFDFPRGVAADRFGNVYVADTGNHRIQKFSSTGAYITQWGSLGSGDGQFASPTGVAVDLSGNVYVADFNQRIQKFSSTGGYLTQWGTNGSGDGQFETPYGVAVDAAGSVYVADLGNHRIQKFSSTGGYLTQWGSLGSGDGQFDYPYGVAVDASGNVLVSDSSNDRIQKFTSTGGYLSQWGTLGSGDGQFNGPFGVAVNSSGSVYVVDTNNDRVQRFAQGSASSPVVSLSADQSSVSPGDPIDYHVTVTNTTGSTLTGVRVTDARAPDCEGALANLAPGASVVVDCTYNTGADDAGAYVNTATLDSDQTNAVASNAVTTQVGPALTVTMSAPSRVMATGSIAYSVGITNNSALPLTGVRVTDAVAPGCSGPVADIAAGATATVNCARVTTDADAGSVVANQAIVDASGAQSAGAVAVTRVQGRVTGTITGPGGPVAGAYVLALSRDFLPLQGDTVANGSGVYNLGLDPGRYYLAFLDPSGATQAEYYNNKTSALALTSADLVTVNVGSGPATANASLAAGFLPVANPATISGTVTDANGPVAGVWVVAVNGGVRSATRTNAAGQYTVGNLPAGNAYLEFADPPGTHAFRWYLNNDGTNPTAIPVTAGQHVTGINQVLPPYP